MGSGSGTATEIFGRTSGEGSSAGGDSGGGSGGGSSARTDPELAATPKARSTATRRDGDRLRTGLYYGRERPLSPHWGRQGFKTTPMITITELAATKVREISKSEGLDGQGLRLRVIGGGCAGFQYDLYFEEKPTDLDERFESHGVALFVDPLSYQYLDETEIDYVESAHGSGFKFQNPNVSSTCGCGSSFKV
jgi:iron-sulfur cluster insertion protein